MRTDDDCDCGALAGLRNPCDGTDRAEDPAAAPAATEAASSPEQLTWASIRVSDRRPGSVRAYRDLRDGANINFDLGRQTETREFSLKGSNLATRIRNPCRFRQQAVQGNGVLDQLRLNTGWMA